jgi:crotonobetainyl-CoA:carnitine CoA-transferase CaiB-like acyl-CoA transferase
MRPLDGMVVLDLTRLLPGAAATEVLVQFGAEVIKIEEPRRGDYGRAMPPVFEAINRGKKSVALDLKDERGREAFLRLCVRADAVIEGFRPGVMARLGLDYEMLRARNPRLIYLAITGYGQCGPYADLAGHDVNYLSLAGVLDLIGPEGGPPVIPGIQIADIAGGSMQAIIGLLLALAARERTGRGQMVDVSMFDGLRLLMTIPLATGAARRREQLSGRYACYNVYQARDGRWVAVGALEPRFWVEVCRGLGCEQFCSEQFVEGARQEEIIAAVGTIFRTRDAEDWFADFRGKDACVTPVRTVAEAAREWVSKAVIPRLSETAGSGGGPVPGLGEHTREVLLWAGLSEQEVNAIAS